MALLERIKRFFEEIFFNPKWRCLSCGKEIFNDEYFCESCKVELPYNDGAICDHCGRSLKVRQDYCSTCKGRLTSFDKCRSVYVYKTPISKLIKDMKYYGDRYLAKLFGQDLASVYFKNYFNADCVVYVPMLNRAEVKRGYNQSKILAQEFSTITGVPIAECVVKKKKTQRQATLGRENRLKNLKDVFSITNKKLVSGKTVVIIDDVTTTGATAEALSNKLKKAGAEKVYLISVASVPSKNNY